MSGDRTPTAVGVPRPLATVARMTVITAAFTALIGTAVAGLVAVL